MKKLSFNDAVRQWVGEFNALPQSLLEKAYDIDELIEMELTPVEQKYQCEECDEEFHKDEFEMAEENEYGEKLCPSCIKYECDTCSEEFEEGEYEKAVLNDMGEKICPHCLEEGDNDLETCISYLEKKHGVIIEDDNYDDKEYGLPMWGTLWSFGTSLDDDWVKNNLELVRDLGFRIYETDEIGVFIGIDGAGYDFYEDHWNKLYKARGLRWHSED